MLIALAAFGGLGYAASAVQSVAHVASSVVTPSKPHVVKTAAASQYGGKTTICHFDGKGRGHTISVSNSAVAGFLARGDHRGACKAGEFKPGKGKGKGGVLGTSRRGQNPSSTG